MALTLSLTREQRVEFNKLKQAFEKIDKEIISIRDSMGFNSFKDSLSIGIDPFVRLTNEARNFANANVSNSRIALFSDGGQLKEFSAKLDRIKKIVGEIEHEVKMEHEKPAPIEAATVGESEPASVEPKTLTMPTFAALEDDISPNFTSPSILHDFKPGASKAIGRVSIVKPSQAEQNQNKNNAVDDDEPPPPPPSRPDL